MQASTSDSSRELAFVQAMDGAEASNIPVVNGLDQQMWRVELPVLCDIANHCCQFLHSCLLGVPGPAGTASRSYEEGRLVFGSS